MATLTHPQTKPHTVAHADLSRLVLGVFLSALGGVMLLLSFPPYGLWPLAWIGFVPFLFAQYRLMPFQMVEPGGGSCQPALAGTVFGETLWHGDRILLHLSRCLDRHIKPADFKGSKLP